MNEIVDKVTASMKILENITYSRKHGCIKSDGYDNALKKVPRKLR